MSNRFEWGPDLNDVVFASAPDAPASRADVQPSFGALDPATGQLVTVDAAGAVHFTKPAHDPAAELAPLVLYVVLLDQAEAVPVDPAAALAHPGAITSKADFPQGPESAAVVVPRPEGVKPGKTYHGKSVLEFVGDEPAPTPEPTPEPTPAPVEPTPVVDPTTPAA